MNKTFDVQNEQKMSDVAKYIADIYINKNEALALFLVGGLGSGKTTFTKYLAKELNVKQNVISPTFILNKEYKINIKRDKKTLQHLDVYRIESETELSELSIDRYIKNKDLIVIEWADKFNTNLLNIFKEVNVIELNFKYKNESERLVNIKKL